MGPDATRGKLIASDQSANAWLLADLLQRTWAARELGTAYLCLSSIDSCSSYQRPAGASALPFSRSPASRSAVIPAGLLLPALTHDDRVGHGWDHRSQPSSPAVPLDACIGLAMPAGNSLTKAP
jgi:hypothetical protein